MDVMREQHLTKEEVGWNFQFQSWHIAGIELNTLFATVKVIEQWLTYELC